MYSTEQCHLHDQISKYQHCVTEGWEDHRGTLLPEVFSQCFPESFRYILYLQKINNYLKLLCGTSVRKAASFHLSRKIQPGFFTNGFVKASKRDGGGLIFHVMLESVNLWGIKKWLKHVNWHKYIHTAPLNSNRINKWISSYWNYILGVWRRP